METTIDKKPRGERANRYLNQHLCSLIVSQVIERQDSETGQIIDPFKNHFIDIGVPNKPGLLFEYQLFEHALAGENLDKFVGIVKGQGVKVQQPDGEKARLVLRKKNDTPEHQRTIEIARSAIVDVISQQIES